MGTRQRVKKYSVKGRNDIKFWPEKIVGGLHVSWMVVAQIDGSPATEACDRWFDEFSDANRLADSDPI